MILWHQVLPLEKMPGLKAMTWASTLYNLKNKTKEKIERELARWLSGGKGVCQFDNLSLILGIPTQ